MNISCRVMLIASIALLGACASTYTSTPFEIAKTIEYCKTKQAAGRNIAVFLDGTENTESDHTNVHRLYNMVALQPAVNGCPSNYALYVKGVGTSDGIVNLVQSITGKGIQNDVQQAYRYIATHYRGPKDKIYIFGFSRGAAAARILSSFIYHAGLITNLHPALKDPKDENEVELLWSMYTQVGTSKRKRSMIKAAVGARRQVHPMIEFLGVWDTVPALEYYFGEINTLSGFPPQYNDQLCNVVKAAHALSIDDNRAKTFTPALFGDNLLDQCVVKRNVAVADIVDEVWFSGAHSDVGGGYLDSDLSAVSLNWMIEQIEDHDFDRIECARDGTGRKPLLPPRAKVYENPFGVTHDSAEVMGWKAFMQNRNRHIPGYLQCPQPGASSGSPCAISQVPIVHSSVIERARELPPVARHFHWTNEWVDRNTGKVLKNYPDCFNKIRRNDIDPHPIEKLNFKYDLKDDAPAGCPVEWERDPRYIARICDR